MFPEKSELFGLTHLRVGMCVPIFTTLTLTQTDRQCPIAFFGSKYGLSLKAYRVKILEWDTPGFAHSHRLNTQYSLRNLQDIINCNKMSPLVSADYMWYKQIQTNLVSAIYGVPDA